jgi:cytochrome c oxidase subunit 3
MLFLKNYHVVNNEQHPFHMVCPSPWPLMTSFSLLALVFGFLSYFHYFKAGNYHFSISFLIVCFFLFRWFCDIITESTFEGNHTLKVQEGIRLGMGLFIISEIMFFFSFFWAFFHCTLSPSIGLGFMWPPQGVSALDPWGLPLWNTVILLSSGVTITCSHRGILAGERATTTNGLLATIIYGIIFTFIQAYEYNVASFSINDGIFGSLFFMLTGFHGFHGFTLFYYQT